MPLEDLADDVKRLARIEYGDPDMPIVYSEGWEVFKAAWEHTPEQDRRTVGPDHKPAICQGKTFDVEMWMTMDDTAWDILQANDRHERHVHDYERACPHCRSVMKVTFEYESSWVHTCPNCRLPCIDAKALIGGTQGQKGQPRGET